MAGRNQHFIPRFLQRAFGIRPTRKDIWYFGRGEEAEKRSVKRTASEDYFYSEPQADGRSTLDDAITRMESDLAALLNEIRAKSPGDTIASPSAAAIVSHLAQRTAHVRAMFSEGVARLLQRVAEVFPERDNVEAFLGLRSAVPETRFRELVMSELGGRPEIARLGMPHRVLERIAFFVVKENVGELVKQGVEVVNAVLDGFQPRSTDLVRDSHNEVLGGMIGSNEYQALLQTFDWSLESGPATGAILPDCVVIGLGSDGVVGNHLFIGGKEMGAIVFAVSPERLLVGRKPGFVLPSDFDYNVEATCLSHTFFLAPRNDEETVRLHAMIGKKLRPALEESVEQGLEHVISEGSKAEAGSQSQADDTLDSKPTAGGRYELSLAGCGDERTTTKVQEEVALLVDGIAMAMPLGRLDGITIGNDYPGLLRMVTRGWENAPTPQTAPPEVGVGVAQTVTVRRSGMAKGRIVVSSIVSDALISDHAEQRAWGRYVLVRQLAAVALMEIVEGCLPGTLLRQAGEGIDGWLYANVDGVPESYAASWMAAAFGDSGKIAPGLRELLVAAIDRFMMVVPGERLAYREHGDLERLLGVTLPEIRHVLMVSANLLGHCAFTGEPPLGRTSVLHHALDRAGLCAWFGVYFDDLARFHQRSGRWESFEEFLAFNIHAERLLLAAGMFAWEGPEGLRVEVPLGSDIEALLARFRKE